MARRTGLVMAGAAARGAYEAGALSVVLPVLENRGQRPTVLVGTSAGALNATFLASRAHLQADVAVKELVDLWHHVDRKAVFDYSLFTLPRLIGQELGITRRAAGFLDTGPLAATLDAAIGDWSLIRRNVAAGHLDALAVVTTAASTGSTVVFVEGGLPRRGGSPRLPKRDDKKGIEYLTPLGGIRAPHLLASAAVPMLFPAVEIEVAKGTSEWFVDGGLRLNTPIKPALELGADRVAIVATDPATHASPTAPPPPTVPDADDLFLHMLQAALADPLVEDMWRLARTNVLVAAGPAGGKRPIEYMFIGPRRRGELGAIASDVTSGPGLGLFKPISWLIGRQGSQHHELLSYLLFHPRFFEKAIQLGVDDARRELRRLASAGLEWRMKPMRVR